MMGRSVGLVLGSAALILSFECAPAFAMGSRAGVYATTAVTPQCLIKKPITLSLAVHAFSGRASGTMRYTDGSISIGMMVTHSVHVFSSSNASILGTGTFISGNQSAPVSLMVDLTSVSTRPCGGTVRVQAVGDGLAYDSGVRNIAQVRIYPER